MVATTHTFTYSGTLQEAVIPAGTTSLDMYLWGGAGGAGGADSGGAGGSGSAGMHVKKTTYTIATNLVGTTVQVGVGGGGAGYSTGCGPTRFQGTINTGGGGGAIYGCGLAACAAGIGGSGIVIVRYKFQ